MAFVECAWAQDTLALPSSDEAGAHLQKAPAPNYPRIAQAAGVQGTVRTLLTVSPEGDVADVMRVSSVPMLDQAVEDALRQWHFQPFVTGTVSGPALVAVAMTFALNKPVAARFEGEVASKYETQVVCDHAVERAEWDTAVSKCERAVTDAGALASAFQSNARWRLGAAYARAGRYNDARENLDKVERASNLNGPLGSFVEARIVLDAADAHVKTNDVAGGLKLYKRGCDSLETLLGHLFAPALIRPRVVEILREELTRYADALEAAGQVKDAQKTRDRAAKVK